MISIQLSFEESRLVTDSSLCPGNGGQIRLPYLFASIWLHTFRSKLRKDFRLAGAAPAHTFLGSLSGFANLLVSINAFDWLDIGRDYAIK